MAAASSRRGSRKGFIVYLIGQCVAMMMIKTDGGNFKRAEKKKQRREVTGLYILAGLARPVVPYRQSSRV